MAGADTNALIQACKQIYLPQQLGIFEAQKIPPDKKRGQGGVLRKHELAILQQAPLELLRLYISQLRHLHRNQAGT